MTGLVLALFIIGAVLLCIEMFVPGFGVVGICGIILLVLSAVITVVMVPFGIFIVVGEVLVLGGIIFALLKFIKKHQLDSKLILRETLNSEQDEVAGLEFFIGKEGISKTALRPFGVVNFNGSDMEVYTSGKFIPENKKVKVSQVSGRKIIVEEIINSN